MDIHAGLQDTRLQQVVSKLTQITNRVGVARKVPSSYACVLVYCACADSGAAWDFEMRRRLERAGEKAGLTDGLWLEERQSSFGKISW